MPVVPLSHRHKVKVAVVCVVVLAMNTGCSEANPLYPSYEGLTQRGFYVYVLPKEEIEQRGWSQTVSIWSWDRHCAGIESSETSNPIYVKYDGSQEQPGFTLIIGPWNMTWDHRRATKEVKVETPWAMDGVALYYTIEDYTRLKIEDRFGIPIQVGSRLPITEVVRLINQLEYIGPPPETVTNPWDYSKCPER